MAKDNRSLGQFILDGIPPAPRGIPQIEVTFDVDANGILNVTAKDKATGKEQKIRIEAGSGLSKEEIEKMKKEAELHAEEDRKAKEIAEKLNQADALIFQSEKQLKEYGDKIPAEKKSKIETALQELKSAYETKEIEKIDPAVQKLNEAWNEAATDMYNAANASTNTTQENNSGTNNSGPSDVEYEEVK
jgi:molecular chaperone DnaK